MFLVYVTLIAAKCVAMSITTLWLKSIRNTVQLLFINKWFIYLFIISHNYSQIDELKEDDFYSRLDIGHTLWHVSCTYNVPAKTKFTIWQEKQMRYLKN